MRVQGWMLAAVLLCGAGCAVGQQEGRGTRDRATGGLFGSAQLVQAPKEQRCAKFGKGSARAACDEALELGQRCVRNLAATDVVCLEGGFGEGVTGSCLARAQVSDAGNGKLLLDIRDAQPSSRWFAHVSSEVWFEDGALVDLYLAERGY